MGLCDKGRKDMRVRDRGWWEIAKELVVVVLIIQTEDWTGPKGWVVGEGVRNAERVPGTDKLPLLLHLPPTRLKFQIMSLTTTQYTWQTFIPSFLAALFQISMVTKLLCILKTWSY